MKKIIAYQIIEENVNQGTRELEARVALAVQQGWQPYGSMATAVPGDTFYSQPMVKYEEQSLLPELANALELARDMIMVSFESIVDREKVAHLERIKQAIAAAKGE